MDRDLPNKPPIELSNPYASPLAVEKPLTPRAGRVVPPDEKLNPWLNIWIRPRDTIRQIIDTNPLYMVIPLAIAAGIIEAFSELPNLPPSVSFPLPLLIVGVLVGGALFGVLQNFLAGFFINTVSHWFGGKGDFWKTCCADAWGSLPTMVGSILIMLVPVEAMESIAAYYPNPNSELESGTPNTTIVILTVMFAWLLYTYVNAVAEVQDFSWIKSLLICLFSLFMVFVAFVMIVALVVVIAAALGVAM